MLDLTAKRYNQKPSDYFDLNDYDSYNLDSALALRYSNEEREDGHEKLHTIIQYLKMIMKQNGAKDLKVEEFKRKIGVNKSDDDDLPLIDDIFSKLGG